MKQASRIRRAPETASEFVAQFAREWRAMTTDPLWAVYGRPVGPRDRAEYIARRVDEIRRNLTPYLHRPECLALAEDLQAARAEVLS